MFTKEGWRQHPGHIELDWTNQKVVSALARWRDQAAKRNNWPQARPEPRVVYANDEKAWIKARVHEYLDAGRPYDIAATNLGFQKVFGHRRKRSEYGIGSVMLRIKREWEKARASSALLSEQLDGENVEGEEDEEQDEEEEAGEGEEAPEIKNEEYDSEETALVAGMEALERANAAEDEALARLEEERRMLEWQQDGGGERSGASPHEPSGEQWDFEDYID